MDAEELWRFLPIGYLLSVAVELPVLLIGLSPVHSLRRRVFAAFWLTACTYPIVVLVLAPLLMQSDSRIVYLAVAETFAPLAEYALFRWLLSNDTDDANPWRDFATIVAANLSSFSVGLLLW